MTINYSKLYADVLAHNNYEGEPTWENVAGMFLDFVDCGMFRGMCMEEAIDLIADPKQRIGICKNLMPGSYHIPKFIDPVKGVIEINSVDGTISIRLENGHYCRNHFANGIKSFLETELEVLQKEVKHG